MRRGWSACVCVYMLRSMINVCVRMGVCLYVCFSALQMVVNDDLLKETLAQVLAQVLAHHLLAVLADTFLLLLGLGRLVLFVFRLALIAVLVDDSGRLAGGVAARL